MPGGIELTPRNPYSLALRTPVIAQSPGVLRVMQRLASSPGVGAVLTARISGRRAAALIQEVPAGVLLTADCWPAEAALRTFDQWSTLEVPALALLAEDDPHELALLIQEFDESAPLAGFVIEAGSAEPALVGARVAAARSVTPLPLFAGLQAHTLVPAQAQAAYAAGAEGLILLYGPGGAAFGEGGLRHGHLDGPAAEPCLLSLSALLREQLPEISLVTLAARVEGAQDLLAIGTQAILLRAGLWREPDLAARIAQAAGA